MTPGIQQIMREIESVRDRFHRALYRDRDLAAALAVTGTDCVLVNLPAGTGGSGADALRRYLADDLLPHLPDDLSFRRVSRTVDTFRVVDELAVAFTHDRELPWLLPGLPPTHRRVEVLAVSVVGVRQSRITVHRTLWDHHGLLSGLAPDRVPSVTDIRATSTHP